MNKKIIYTTLSLAIALAIVVGAYNPGLLFADTVSGQTYTYTSVNNAKCNSGSTLGSTSFDDWGGSCTTFCAGLHAACCTEKVHWVDDAYNPEPNTVYTTTCTARGGTATTPVAFSSVTRPPPGLGYPRTTVDYSNATLFTYSTTTVTAALVANPTSISSGQSSLLTWSGTGASTCSGTGFSTAGATSGSVSVSPSTTTTYTVTCSNGALVATDSKTVTVQNLLSVSCVANPNPGTVYQGVTWSSSVSGATGSYTYSWSGSDSLSGSSSSVSKTYTTTGAKSATLLVTSGSSSVSTMCNNTVCQTTSCTCTGPSCGVIVAEGGSTDLTAGTPTLHTGLNETGNTATFEAQLINNGDNSITATFPNRFQADTNSDGSYDVNLDVGSTAYSIGLGGTVLVVSPAWSNLPAGTHLVRLCADTPSAVTESNEGNNCGTPLAFSVGSSPLTLSLTANPTRAHKNGTVTLTWTSTNADSCTVTGTGFSASGLSGSQLATVTADTTYTLACVRGSITTVRTVSVQLAPAFEEI